MTEAEWLACTHLVSMLQHLHGRSSDRKVRLFACACCRRIWHLLTDERFQSMVEVAERYADGASSQNDLRDASRKAFDGAMESKPCTNDDMRAIACILAGATDPHRAAAETVFYASSAAMGLGECDDSDNVVRGPEFKKHTALIRDIFGNPFNLSPPLPPWLLAWNDGTVRRIAEGIYSDRAFDRLPILADALEDAGCDNVELIRHCRNQGLHVRGCWPVDLILGKS